MPEEFKFDAFLSHIAKDKPLVHKLTTRLQRDDVRMWLDNEQMNLADGIQAKFEERLRFLASGSVHDRYARPTSRLTWASRLPSLWPCRSSLAVFSSLVRSEICRPV